MLKRLKWRFIRINMLLVGIAVAVMFASVCVLTYRNGKSQLDRAINNALRIEERPAGLDADAEPKSPPADEIPENRQDGQAEASDIRLPSFGRKDELAYIHTVTVIVFPDGSYLREDIFGADIDDETLAQAVEKTTSSSRQSGTISSLNLAWKRMDSPRGTKIAFASTNYLSDSVRTSALISGGVSLVSLLLFFGMSYLLAGIVIRPTADAWEKQKRFVADASHDLKTPLTVILANTDILREASDSTVAEQMQWVESTAEEAQRMRGLVNQMLELAKSEDVSQNPALSPLSLSDLTERTALQFEPIAFERGVSIETEIMPNVVLPCHEDSFVRLAQILIDNAVKYSPDGETVTVALTPYGTGAVFSVKNFGTPISSEDLPHLFERFYRADKARSAGGFGLGLSIAKNLAESLRAKISVTSSADTGTIFTVKFQK